MSKCDAGVEIPPYADCPKCGAGPSGPCWVGLQRDEAELKRLRESHEKLRRTLEQRSVRLMGPRSPFWQCEYCQALSQTPIAFKHKPECLMAVTSGIRKSES